VEGLSPAKVPTIADVKRSGTTRGVILKELETNQLESSTDNKRFYALLQPLGYAFKEYYKHFRDMQIADGFTPPEARRAAALEIAEIIRELPEPEGMDEPAKPKGKRKKKGELPFNEVINKVAERKDRKAIPLAQVVSWVSSNLLRDLQALNPDDVPSLEAVSMLKWAKANETEYRKIYDSKRVPQKGFVSDTDAGFVDDGSPVKDILAGLKEGLPHVIAVHHLQAPLALRHDGPDGEGAEGTPPSGSRVQQHVHAEPEQRQEGQGQGAEHRDLRDAQRERIPGVQGGAAESATPERSGRPGEGSET
jgi:hypothetical protein